MAKAQFERSEIINRVTDVFWANGFNGSSMQDVFAATGLKPGSIYLAFGNKETLYAEALSHYAERSRKEIASTLNSAPSIEEGLCEIFYRLLDEATKNDYCSCFLVKSQMELASENTRLHEIASAELVKTEQLYQAHLSQIVDHELATARANSIMLHIFGLRVYGYHTNSKVKVIRGLMMGLPWLPWKEAIAR